MPLLLRNTVYSSEILEVDEKTFFLKLFAMIKTSSKKFMDLY